MEIYRCRVDNLGQLARLVKGSKAHQFTTESGMRIYFNDQGLPINVADDTPVTDLESNILERWTHEYFYNLVVTNPVTALNTIKNASGSIILECLEDAKTGKKYCYKYWQWQPGSEYKFTVKELLYGTWYTVINAY